MTTQIDTSDVLIVGAGITGLACAISLAEKGVKVTVVERYQPAAMASGWTLAGVRQSGRDPAELLLAQRAVMLWQTLDEQLGSATGYRQTGNLRLARTQTESDLIRRLVKDQHKSGLDIELLEPSELHEKVPALNTDLHCASFCRSDGQADPLATSMAYRKAADRLGVGIMSDTFVKRIDMRAGRFHSLETSAGNLQADACILATGVQTNELLSALSITLPIRWARVTVMQSEPLPPILSPVIGVANADLALRQEAQGRFRMTSGADYTDARLLVHEGLPVVPTSEIDINDTLARISRVLPMIAGTRISSTWGGLLDMTPDGLPVIDYLPGNDGVIVAAGFSGHGFGIGPAVGETIAELITQADTTIPLGAFSFERFNSQPKARPELHG